MLDLKSLLISEEEYLKTDALNYSLLKVVDESPDKAVEFLTSDIKKDTKALRSGSLIDDILSGYKDLYIVYPGIEPDGKGREVCLEVIKNLNIDYSIHLSKTESIDSSINRSKFVSSVNSKDYFSNARIIVGYYSNRKDDTVIPTLMPYWDFITINFINPGKLIISEYEMSKATKLAESVLNDPYCKVFLEGDEEFPQAGMVIDYITEGINTKLKGLADKIVVKHGSKTIYIVDYKSYSGDFVSNYYYYKYYIQATLYLFILRDILYTIGSDYTCEFVFIAISKDTGVATVYKHSEFITYWEGGYQYVNLYGFNNRLLIKGIIKNIKDVLHIKHALRVSNNQHTHYPSYYVNGYYTL